MSRLLDISSLTLKDAQGLILNKLCLHVEKGERVAIVGESGSGKTMTLRSLLHMLPSDVELVEGSVSFRGNDVLSLSYNERRDEVYRHLGFVGQNTSESLHPLIKIRKQMTDFYIEEKKCKKSEAEARARDVLLSVGLSDVDRILSSYPRQLSGGMKQRVNIAIALMKDIEFLVADEPTSALDANVRGGIEQLYLEISKNSKLSILLISHDLNFVRTLAQRVYVMYGGKLVEEGTVQEIFSYAVHPYTKALIELCNMKYRNREEDLQEPGFRLTGIDRSLASCPFAATCPSASMVCCEDLEYRALSETHYVRCPL